MEFTGAAYPKGKDEKYEFSAKPLNVYSGDFELPVHFKAGADAKKGMGTMTGKLRFQACNATMCLPPRTIEVPVPVFVNE